MSLYRNSVLVRLETLHKKIMDLLSDPGLADQDRRLLLELSEEIILTTGRMAMKEPKVNDGNKTDLLP